jgi:hypothetical protein
LNEPEGMNKHFNTLSLFSKHTYSQYKNNKDNFIHLNDKMIHKLRIITLLDFVKDQKNVQFETLFKLLDITDSFELDSVIFDAVSLGLISGKVDQKNQILKVK